MTPLCLCKLIKHKCYINMFFSPSQCLVCISLSSNLKSAEIYNIWHTQKPDLAWPWSRGLAEPYLFSSNLAWPQMLAWSQIWLLQNFLAPVLFTYLMILLINVQYTWNIIQDRLIVVDFDSVCFWIPKYLKNV